MATATLAYDESYYDESYYDEMESLLGAEGRWETEADEERRYPRYRPGRRPVPRPRPYQPIPGVAGARIQTPAGRAEVQFPKPMATKEALDNLARELKAEIARLSATVKGVSDELNKNTAMLDKKINTLNSDFKKYREQSLIMFMLPLLLTKPPGIEKITFESNTFSKEMEISQTHYKKTDTTMLLLLPFMMMGGLGGEGDAANMMMMLALVLALGKE